MSQKKGFGEGKFMTSGKVDDSLWEVFLQEKNNSGHVHVGSLRACGSEEALQAARDVYARRGSPISIWVALSESIVASTPADAPSFFDPKDAKSFRYPNYYKVPRTLKDA